MKKSHHHNFNCICFLPLSLKWYIEGVSVSFALRSTKAPIIHAFICSTCSIHRELIENEIQGRGGESRIEETESGRISLLESL